MTAYQSRRRRHRHRRYQSTFLHHELWSGSVLKITPLHNIIATKISVSRTKLQIVFFAFKLPLVNGSFYSIRYLNFLLSIISVREHTERTGIATMDWHVMTLFGMNQRGNSSIVHHLFSVFETFACHVVAQYQFPENKRPNPFWLIQFNRFEFHRITLSSKNQHNEEEEAKKKCHQIWVNCIQPDFVIFFSVE